MSLNSSPNRQANPVGTPSAFRVHGRATPDEPAECEVYTKFGLRLAARLWGNDEAPIKVIATHGWLDNAATWNPLLEFLFKRSPDRERARSNLQFLCLDFAGHGRSEHRARRGYYDFAEWGADVLDAADAIGWSRFALLGHSMGGAVASMVAAIAPERVTRVVAVEQLGIVSRSADKLVSTLRQWMRDRNALAAGSRPLRSYTTHQDAVRKMVSKNPYIGERSALLLTERAMQRSPNGDSLHFLHDPAVRSASPFRLTEEQARHALAAIECPFLFISGSLRNYPLDETQVLERQKCIKDLRRVHFPGKGHHLHMDAPEEVAPEVLAFLLEQNPPPRAHL